MGGLFYEKDPEAIYRASFATIEAEADLSGVKGAMRALVIRVVHACGRVEVAQDLRFSDGASDAGLAALRSGAAIITDVEMVASGIIRSRLPADNVIHCGLREEGLADHAKTLGNTKSAAGLDLLKDRLGGAVVVIGNAPTALFHLLDCLRDGAPKPALILGFPVGFVGAVESKDALHADSGGVPYVTLLGRMGGSAMAAAALNALAGFEASHD